MSMIRAKAVKPADTIAQILARATDLTARGHYAAALPIFTTVYEHVATEKYPQGLSSYGLCLSRIERKSREGVELCERAMTLQPGEALHRANLVRLYAAANNRRKAVETLEKGLRRLRPNAKLLLVRDEIGYRRSPSLRFLPRRHPLNRFYSRCAQALVTPLTMSALVGAVATLWR
jgi:tetratricopeptide (TPR) repeat protein